MTGVDAQKPAWSKRAWRLWQHHSQGRRNPKWLQWLPAHETWSESPSFFGRNHGELGDMSGFTYIHIYIYVYTTVNIYIYIHISGYQIIRVNNGLDIHGTNTFWFVAEPPGAPSPVNCRPDTPMPQLPSKNMGSHISPTILPCLLWNLMLIIIFIFKIAIERYWEYIPRFQIQVKYSHIVGGKFPLTK